MELKTRAPSSQNPPHHSRVQLTSIKTPHNPNLPCWSHNMCSPLTPNPPHPPVRPTLASSPPAHWPPRSRDQTEASDWSAGRDQSQLFAGGAPGRLSCPPPPLPVVASTHCCCHYATGRGLLARGGVHA